MFPETDGISNIISDTMKVVFQRRLVDRVLRLWKEMAHQEPFPRRHDLPGLLRPRFARLPAGQEWIRTSSTRARSTWFVALYAENAAIIAEGPAPRRPCAGP